MPKKSEIESTRREIERLFQRCQSNFSELVRIAESGVLPGAEGDQLCADMRQREHEIEKYFRAALSAVDGLTASDATA